jgi:CheY-like chemotaxis protein
VDDSISFLDSLTEAISVPNVTLVKFTSPSEALSYINEVSGINRLDYSDLTRGGEEGTSDWKSILLNINCLHREIYDMDRFSRISTVVVDYSMPGMKGVELCSNIDDKNIQKVLLTGVADEKIAIDAFNGGYINRFVKKGVDDFELEVAENIDKSIYQYFKAYTDDISKHLSVYDKTHLKDPIFANFFFNTCLSRTYVEYYMLDTFGGYLFLNSKGQPSLLSVLTEYEMSRIVDIGIESGEISNDVLEGLKSREYMLVSHDRSGQLPPISEWGNYLKPARRLEGYQTYYFSFAGAESLDLDFDDIKSFDQFQKDAL